MKKGKTIILIIAIIVIAGLSAFFILNRRGNESNVNSQKEVTKEPTAEAKKDSDKTSDVPSATVTPAETAKLHENDYIISDYSYNEAEPADILYDLAEEDISYDEINETSYINNILIVCFTDDSTDTEKQAVLSKYGEAISGQSDTYNEVYLRVASQDLNGLMELSDTIEEEEIVELSTPELISTFESESYDEPNDPWKEGTGNYSWDEENPGDSNYFLEVIEARGAWQYADRLSTVKVGIIDSPILMDHEDLKGVVQGESDDDIIQKKDNIYNVDIHGTHIAGIIGAIHDNGKGLDGVAINSEIIGVDVDNAGFLFKFFDDLNPFSNNTGSQFSHLLKRIVAADAKVINVSWGLKDLAKEKRVIDKYAKHMSRVIKKLLDKGYDFIVVQAAGNSGVDAQQNGLWCCIDKNNCYGDSEAEKEQILDRIIIVGATEKEKKDNKYNLTDFSNFGDQISICAPGRSIYSTIYPYYDRKHNKKYDSDYIELKGTSMAAPIVSGVCALVWGADPSLTGAEVKKIVCSKENTSYEVYGSESEIYYMVNARLSVEKALGIEKPTPTPTPTSTPMPTATPTPTPVPTTVNIDKSRVAELYTQAVMEKVNETAKIYRELEELRCYTEYSFYDIDKDGVPELLVHWGGPTDGGMSISIYTVKDNELILSSGELSAELTAS